MYVCMHKSNAVNSITCTFAQLYRHTSLTVPQYRSCAISVIYVHTYAYASFDVHNIIVIPNECGQCVLGYVGSLASHASHISIS